MPKKSAEPKLKSKAELKKEAAKNASAQAQQPAEAVGAAPAPVESVAPSVKTLGPNRLKIVKEGKTVINGREYHELELEDHTVVVLNSHDYEAQLNK